MAGDSAAATGRTIGVLGGGQLGRMMGLAGIPLGFGFRFLDPGLHACAGATGQLMQAAFDDAGAARALRAALGVARALEYAHARGVLHRDLSRWSRTASQERKTTSSGMART